MPKLRITLPDGNDLTHEITEETLTIGRLPDNGLQIEDDSVSSHHAVIESSGGRLILKDLDSTNGTFVNGEQISEVALDIGTAMRFGQVDAVLADDVSAPAGPQRDMPATAPAPAHEAGTGAHSVRPATFVNASPFPKAAPKTDALTYAAVACAVIGAIGFAAAVALTLMIQAPA